MTSSVKELIKSEAPLSDYAVDFLLSYQEEDTLVDYKVTFHNEEREWLEITKDVMAFANTNGGYLVFGVKDGTFEKVGLDEITVRTINDPNNIIQKINRNVAPGINLIRCKHFERDNKNFVVVFVPPSQDKSHIITKDASFKFQSGKEKKVLSQGTSYVRRSAGNHMMDARDLDDIINRRIDHFKGSLLDKISRVVEAPEPSEVLIVSEDDTTDLYRKFTIQDGPDAIEIKGMSFTVAPATTEQEVAAWIAMTSRDPEAIPSPGITWKWYKERRSMNLSSKQMLKVGMYCLLTGVPAFYWMIGCEAKQIKEMLIETLSHRPSMEFIGTIISVGAFLGNKFHHKLINDIGSYAERLAPAKRTIPSAGPRVLFRAENIRPQSGSDLSTSAATAEFENELDDIAKSAEKASSHQPPLQSRWRAESLDCLLYAQDDQYLSKGRK